ncbi:MAG: hypothetical protein OJF52_000944 [Nitrospira sp.]|jgi:hypothetical protein|nr:MAG: hypothetical protein OJF52_000944 [Nitrospira sp.]
MASGDRYIKASRYDLEAQRHNRSLFNRRLAAQPWLALVCGMGMSTLGLAAVSNWIEAPIWERHPWEGWLLGGVAFLVACYFCVCVVKGWRNHVFDGTKGRQKG